MATYTHDDLVGIAKRWLARSVANCATHGHGRCSLVLTELVTLNEEIPDAIGWSWGRSILVECKASLADFRADAKKPFRRMPELGMGSQRYYLAPEGVIPCEAIPDGWGLLEVNEKGQVVMAQSCVPFEQYNHRGEITMLLSHIRREGR